MSSKIHAVTVIHLDVGSLASGSDQAILGHMRFALSHSKKRLFPKTLKCDRYRIERAVNRVTIRMYNGDAETARFSFVPPSSLRGLR